VGDPRPLHLVQHAILRQALDRRDLLADGLPHGDRARARRGTVDVHRAGAALRDAAPVFGARQPDRLPQYPEQRRVRIDVHVVSLSIDAECSHLQPAKGRGTRMSWARRIERSSRAPCNQISLNCFNVAMTILRLKTPQPAVSCGEFEFPIRSPQPLVGNSNSKPH
jgi:hypothetical protein